MTKCRLIASLLIAGGFFAATDVCRGAKEISVRTLAKGAFSGITNKHQLVITNAPVWEQFWAKHNVSMKPAEKVPPVDFEREMVIAISMGTQRTGGYRIEITSVEAEADKLLITYKRYAPPPNGINLQVITSPFHFVAVPKMDLKAEFVEAAK